MRWIHHLGFVLLVTLAAPAAAQRGLPLPLYDFKDIAVANPTSAQRVKVAIVRTALNLRWDIVEESDGSLLAWTTRSDTFFIKLRITYDAQTYSVAYVDSKDLKFMRPEDLDDRRTQSVEAGLSRYLDKFKDSPDSPFATRMPFYIHATYDDILRKLLGAMRRHVDAPDV